MIDGLPWLTSYAIWLTKVTHSFTIIAIELSITDAAQTLGISPNTVRRRLTSGFLTGNKVDRKWLINVEETELPSSTPPHVESTESTALVQHLEALIAAQEAELSARPRKSTSYADYLSIALCRRQTRLRTAAGGNSGARAELTVFR